MEANNDSAIQIEIKRLEGENLRLRNENLRLSREEEIRLALAVDLAQAKVKIANLKHDYEASAQRDLTLALNTLRERNERIESLQMFHEDLSHRYARKWAMVKKMEARITRLKKKQPGSCGKCPFAGYVEGAPPCGSV